MAEAQSGGRPPAAKRKPKRKKLPRLPQNAKVEQRPLIRPAIPSPYAGANQQKIVYISARTPFLSAVKRVEKLLDLADKRLVQSATTNAKQQGGGKRKRGAEGDEILGIAEEVERLKSNKRKRVEKDVGETEGDVAGVAGVTSAGEEVILKGTGKAIHRVLELALWFQQREQQYVVRLKTGSVGAIDDVSVEENGVSKVEQDEAPNSGEQTEAGAEEADVMDVDGEAEGGNDHPNDATEGDQDDGAGAGAASTKSKKERKKKHGEGTLASDEVPDTRLRYASFLEAAVSLR